VTGFAIPLGPTAAPATRSGVRAGIFAFGAAMILVTVALIAEDLWEDRQYALDLAAQRTESVAEVLAEHTARTVETIDLTLANIVREIENRRAEDRLTSFDPEIRQLLRREIAHAPQMRALIVTDAAGTVTQSSANRPASPITVADRRYFIGQRDGTGTTGLFIDRPARSRMNDKWFIGMSRRLSNPDGSFAGIVAAIAEPDYFRGLYRSLQGDHRGRTSPHKFIGLLRVDGAPLVLSSETDHLFSDSVWPMLSVGVPWSLAIGGESIIGTTRAVPGWPLFVVVEQPRDAVLAHWREDLRHGIVFCLVIGSAVFLLTGLLGQQLRRRERSEIALRESQERLELALSGTSDGLWDWTIPLGAFWCSPRFRQMLGYAEEELVLDGSGLEAWIHPEDRRRVRAELERHWRSRAPFEVESRLRRRDGTYKWYSIRGQTVWSDTGRPMRMAGSIDDVTERKQAEAWLMSALDDLQESEAKLRSLMSNIPGACYRCLGDGHRTMQFISDAILEISGYKADEFLSGHVRHLTDLIHPDDRPVVEHAVGRAVRSRHSFDLEYRILHRDGSIRWVHEKGLAVFNQSGDLLYLDGVIFDVTERRRAEEELRAAKEAAEAANSAKSEFLATMSHEIRTPMNGILGMTGLLLDSPLDEEQRLYARSIHQSADALLTIINDILDFSKLEADRLTLETIDFDVAAVVASVGELCGPRAHAKGLDLGIFVDPSMPQRLRGDPSRLRQILLNLVGNAIKFTESGGVAVEVSDLGEPRTGNEVVLLFKITDSGIGIPKDVQGRLFTKFTQADSSTTRRFGGTGLGLAISKQLVERMGGRIGLESEPGKGSTFWFTVRFAAAENQAAAKRTEEDSGLRGLRALVVDGNRVNRLIFEKLMVSWGMSVRSVENGPAALKALDDAWRAGQPFDVALIDRSMAGMDGETLGRRIRANPAFAAMHLVLVAPFGDPVDGATKNKAAEFAARLCKPVSQTQLLTCLRDLVGAPAPRPRRDRTGQAPESGPKPPDGRPLRILLAEDNQVNQLLTVAILEKAGHRVDIAGNGIEAVEAVLNRPYDIVLMDIQMPEMDGIQATRRIRALPDGKGRIPIIAITANAMRGDRERLLQAGMNDYVAKPIDRTHLFEVIRRWSGGHGSFGGSADAEAEPAAANGNPAAEAALSNMIESLSALRRTGSDDA